MNNILVTGTQRSGTTWVGKVLSSNGKVNYYHEPFNNVNHFIHQAPFDYPFVYVNNSIDSEANQAFSKYLEYFLNPGFKFLWNSIKNVRSIDSRFVIPSFQFLSLSTRKRTNLIKDPFALLSAPWLVESYNWRTLIMVRHPAAYALSMKKKKWILNPLFLINQYRQIPFFDASIQNQIQEYIAFPNKKEKLIESAAMGYNILQHVINHFQLNYKDWIFQRHEDLLINPLTHFEEVYRILGLEFTENVKAFILKSTQSETNSLINRNSKKMVKAWKQQLNDDEIRLIYDKTNQTASQFYSDADW